MLKLTAMLFMLIDHIALVFFPPTTPLYLICRLIGRLAMPIFAYKIAIGFIYTKNLNHYIKRVGLMTLYAQIPFIWMALDLSFSELLSANTLIYLISIWNVGLTFICSLLILKFFEELYYTTAQYPALNIIYIALLCLVSMVADYSIYGVLMVIIFYIFIKYKHSYSFCACLLVGATLLYYLPTLQSGIYSAFLTQLPCVLSLVCIKYLPDNCLPFNTQTGYTFYPLHMLVLALLGSLIK